jgi:hypothetical protein
MGIYQQSDSVVPLQTAGQIVSGKFQMDYSTRPGLQLAQGCLYQQWDCVVIEADGELHFFLLHNPRNAGLLISSSLPKLGIV